MQFHFKARRVPFGSRQEYVILWYAKRSKIKRFDRQTSLGGAQIAEA